MSENQGNPANNGRGDFPVKVQTSSHPHLPAWEAYGPGSFADSGQMLERQGLGLAEYWRIALKRKWLIISLALSFFVLGGIRILLQTPLYTSTVRLQIDRNVAKIVEGGNVTPIEGTDLEFLKTQYELLQSRTMAERVASALKLGEDADFMKPRDFPLFAADRAKDKKSQEQAAAGVVMENRSVRPVAESRLVDIAYTDPVAYRAQKIAAAYAEAFIAANLDKRFQANAYAKSFLEDQLKQLKLRLEESEKVLLDFAQKEKIVVVTEKASMVESNLTTANAALEHLVSERIKNEELWKQAESATGITLPQLLTNNVIDALRTKRNALVSEYQEKLETFKPSYPAMVQITNKIAEIDRQLKVEVATIKSSLRAAYQSSLSQEAEMRKRIEDLRAEALDLQKRSIQYNILKREVDTTRSLYEGLLQRYKEVDVAAGVGANNIFIVDPAELPSSPSSPQIGRSVLLALVLGLGAGLAVAYLLEQFDSTVGSVEELERVSGLRTLGLIPRMPKQTKLEAELADPRSVLSEAYRSLGTALQFATENGPPKTLLFTSAGPSEGKSITTLALARHFANLGLKVLAIDADLRNPSLHLKIGLPNNIGLTDYLTGGCAPGEAFQNTDLHNLKFMASGALAPNAAGLLDGPRLLSLLAIGREVFDLILIDGPPVMGLADAQLLTSAASATVFLVGAGEAQMAAVQGSLRRLQLARGVLIGAVLTKYDAKTAPYGYGYGYGYRYSGYGRPGIQGALDQHSLTDGSKLDT